MISRAQNEGRAAKARVLAVVTARGGSKRLPGKNLMPLGGRSLVAHTADFLKSEGFLDRAVLSTDSEAIAEEGRRCGLAVPFLRPAHLSSDTATSLSVVLHALDHQAATTGEEPDFVAVLQPTSPFRRNGLLSDALELLDGNGANSVVAMVRLHVPARFVFAASDAGAVRPIAEGSEPVLVPSGSMYIVRTTALRSQGSIYADPIRCLEVAASDAIDIDTEDDLRMAEAVLTSRALHPGTSAVFVPHSLQSAGSGG